VATIVHSRDPADGAAMAAMRPMLAGVKGTVNGPDARAPFDHLMELVPSAPGIAHESAERGGVPRYWARPPDAVPGLAILYLHGGGYVVGSARAYQHFAGQFAARAKAAVFVPDYRLGPEHPFPAAARDARAAYGGLVAAGFARIALAGDSAGGGLALVWLALAAAEVREGAGQRPVCAAVVSPWTDLALTGESLTSRAEADPLSTKASLSAMAALYLAGHDAADLVASPLRGDLAGLPPVRLDVGRDDVLLDDSVRHGERMERAGGSAEVHVWDGMIHVFPSNVGLLKAAQRALEEIGDLLRRHLN